MEPAGETQYLSHDFWADPGFLSDVEGLRRNLIAHYAGFLCVVPFCSCCVAVRCYIGDWNSDAAEHSPAARDLTRLWPDNTRKYYIVKRANIVMLCIITSSLAWASLYRSMSLKPELWIDYLPQEI